MRQRPAQLAARGNNHPSPAEAAGLNSGCGLNPPPQEVISAGFQTARPINTCETVLIGLLTQRNAVFFRRLQGSESCGGIFHLMEAQQRDMEPHRAPKVTAAALYELVHHGLLIRRPNQEGLPAQTVRVGRKEIISSDLDQRAPRSAAICSSFRRASSFCGATTTGRSGLMIPPFSPAISLRVSPRI